MTWTLSNRADSLALPIADRHYNRQKPGTPQFVPPGRCVVLRSATALWVTSWPFKEYVKHDWGGAWVNSCFRNEVRANRSSDLVRDALSATRFIWQEVPWIDCKHCSEPVSMVTFIDTDKVRKKRDEDYGKCYQRAGFRMCKARTKGGLVVVHIHPMELPLPLPPIDAQLEFA